MHALPLSPVRGDPTAATRALLALAQEQWEQRTARADEARKQAIIVALDSGLSARDVGEAMGISPQRVLQLRGDTR